MINLRHINGLVGHQDHVVHCVTACIPDSSINNLLLSRQLRGIKTTNHNYMGMLMDYRGMSAHHTSVNM
jgi:hypothetical protein